MKIQKILAVDNDPTVLKLLSNFLNELGYEVKTAYDGISALSVLKDFSPDIIFTDWIMENIGGEKLCQILRSVSDYDKVPIVALSAAALEKRIDIKKLGINACVAKGPFKETSKYIEELLTDFENGRKKIENPIGLETLYKRQITKELLTLLQHKDIALDNIKEGIIEITHNNQIVYANKFATELLGLPEYNLLSSNILYVLGEPIKENNKTKLYKIASKYVSVSISPIPGTLKSSIVVIHDITEQIEYEKKLHNLSIRDELTSLLNRRGFMTLAEKQLNIAERTKRKVYFLYADLDNLKKINDMLGHEAGDELLIEAANILNKTFRKSDIIGRLGGDEFSVLQVEIPQKANIRNTLSRLQKNIDQFNAVHNKEYELSLSVGTVLYDPNAPLPLDKLISSADKLMYEEKKRKIYA